MDIYITAQITGFLGYIFLTSAPNLKSQEKIIQMDILACFFLCLQWIMLEQPTLIILNALNLSISLFCLNTNKQTITQRSVMVICLVGCVALISVSKGTIIDILCVFSFLLIVTAKLSNNIIIFRNFSIMAGSVFVICGIIVASLPTILFNALFMLLHLRKTHDTGSYLLRTQSRNKKLVCTS